LNGTEKKLKYMNTHACRVSAFRLSIYD